MTLTVKEYADRKRVHPETVREWIRRKLIPAERIGEHGNWRITVIDCHLPSSQEHASAAHS